MHFFRIYISHRSYCPQPHQNHRECDDLKVSENLHSHFYETLNIITCVFIYTSLTSHFILIYCVVNHFNKTSNMESIFSKIDGLQIANWLQS